MTESRPLEDMTRTADDLTDAEESRRQASPPGVPGGSAGRRRVGRILLAITAIVLAVIWALPLLWVVSSSFKPHFEIVGPVRQWLPQVPTLNNWNNLVDPTGRAVNIFVAFANSTVVAIAATVGALLVCSMAAYAFARLRFPGRGPLFVILLATLMLPFEVILVPLFLQFHRFGLLNSYTALILPHVVSVLGIFLLRQFMLSIPSELEDAGKVDGANTWQVFWHVILPLTRPALATLAIFVFLAAWNDFLWPLIVVSEPEMQTLPLALVTFRSAYTALDYGTVLASVVLAIAPPLVLFLFAQKFVIQGISRSGLKG